jgi:hypothetical protein
MDGDETVGEAGRIVFAGALCGDVSWGLSPEFIAMPECWIFFSSTHCAYKNDKVESMI